MSDKNTLVMLAWRKRRRNHRLLFGEPQRRIRLDWQRSIAAFQPGDIFGYERWEANKFGTQHWSIYVAQAGQHSNALTVMPGVKPGAVLLTKMWGSDACKRFLKRLDMLRAQSTLSQISATKWRLIGHEMDSSGGRTRAKNYAGYP